MKVGRDPGSDIIVRDARVSRHHAEIVFERGFFVLRDLDSANGSFVNGKRIRNAPLTEGAEILLGDTRGKFSEGLDEQPSRHATSPGDEARHTRPVPLTAEVPPQTTPAAVEEEQNFRGDRFVFEIGDDHSAWMIEESTQRRFRFRNPRSLVSLVTTLVFFTIATAGLTVTLFLAQQGAPLRAAVATLLTIAFGVLIAAMTPRKRFTMRDALDGNPLLTLMQVSVPSALSRTFRATIHGTEVANFRRNALTNLGRRRWSIFNGVGAAVGHATEDSMLRALLRKPFGSFIGALRTDFEIRSDERELARFLRRGEKAGRRYVLEIRDASLDRGLAVSLGLLLTCVER